jgi:hypothetical protein
VRARADNADVHADVHTGRPETPARAGRVTPLVSSAAAVTPTGFKWLIEPRLD